MKALFYHLVPFAFAHGGLAIQILRTRDALQEIGVEVEFLRWWDDRQSGEVLHFGVGCRRISCSVPARRE